MTKYITTGNKNLQSIHCSNAVINGNTVYLCGQIAIDYKSGDILRSDFKEQANTAFKNVEILLNEIGSGLDKVCMCNVYYIGRAHV